MSFIEWIAITAARTVVYGLLAWAVYAAGGCGWGSMTCAAIAW